MRRMLGVNERARRHYLARRVLGLCLAAAFAIVAPHFGARAQATLVPAQDESSLLGPRHAEGVVIWSHGRSVEVEDSLAPTPGYIAEMRKAGWDTFRLNRLRAGDTLSASALELAAAAEGFKLHGYRRVVLAGQSFGAFISLMAAGRSDAVDVVIGTAPAAYGTFERNYDTFRLNASKLYEILAGVRKARVALVFFHGDDFDPGGRGERSLDILERQGLSSLVIDQPPRLETHWAASTPEFTRRYARCLIGFAERDTAEGALDCSSIAGAHLVATQ